MGIRMLVVDDHTLVRQAIVNFLSEDQLIEVVGEASNGFEAVNQARELQPDAILMDFSLSGMDGIAATRVIKGELPKTQIILLTDSTEEENIREALQAGARGYILKQTEAGSLTQQIKQVLSGGVTLAEDPIEKLLSGLVKNAAAESGRPQPLSPREKEALGLISQGMTNKEIASQLAISHNTVRDYVRGLMQKLNLDNRTQVAIYGIRQGFGLDSKEHESNNGSSPLVTAKVP